MHAGLWLLMTTFVRVRGAVGLRRCARVHLPPAAAMGFFGVGRWGGPVVCVKGRRTAGLCVGYQFKKRYWASSARLFIDSQNVHSYNSIYSVRRARARD